MIRILLATLTAVATLTSSAFAEERKVKVEFDAPATNYGVTIQEVYRVGDELWVISTVSKQGDFGGAAITRVSDEVAVEAPKDLKVVHKVLGKSWNWGEDTKTLQYVKSEKDLNKQLKTATAERIWQRKR
jgi:hypothetical protein